MMVAGARRMTSLTHRQQRRLAEDSMRRSRVAVDVLIAVGARVLAAPVAVECLGRVLEQAWRQPVAGRGGAASGCVLLGKGCNGPRVAACAQQAEEQTGKEDQGRQVRQPA